MKNFRRFMYTQEGEPVTVMGPLMFPPGVVDDSERYVCFVGEHVHTSIHTERGIKNRSIRIRYLTPDTLKPDAYPKKVELTGDGYVLVEADGSATVKNMDVYGGISKVVMSKRDIKLLWEAVKNK